MVFLRHAFIKILPLLNSVDILVNMEASPLLPDTLLPGIINVFPPSLLSALDMFSDLMVTFPSELESPAPTESKTDSP